MSSSIDVRKRPGIWSYFSFTTHSNPRRRISVSLPTKRYHPDPFEKAGRHSSSASNRSLMNDIKIATMNQGQRTRYLKAGGLITFILFIWFFLGPGRARGDGPFPGGDVASDPVLGTKKCTRSYDSHKPLIQYALMIDAGSTGSRIHVYRFNNCGPTPELEDEVFEMTKPKPGGAGLSAYPDNPEAAAMSLDPLMETAIKNVPDKLKSCTPIAVKATAGLRKLGEEKSQKILEAVRHRLETAYPFPVVARDRGGVEVMDGKDEGVYAWITANYLLGKIGRPDNTPTAAVFDLGGGSTQIVFQPTFKEAPNGGMPDKLADGDHKYELSFGGRKFTLYQHSYLGYGLMSARENLHKVVFDAVYEENQSDTAHSWLAKPILNPCIAPGMSRPVNITLSTDHKLAAHSSVTTSSSGPKIQVNMTGPTTGAPAQCRALAEKTLEKHRECQIYPCAFNGVHQPSLEKTFAREDVYLFSYFYDRTQPLGMPESFTLAELRDLTQRVCQGEKAGMWDVFHSVEGAVKELRDRPEHCLDLSFMLALLHTGYEIPIDREVKIAKKIRGNELGWCLGASLPLLSQESGWQCKIREVA